MENVEGTQDRRGETGPLRSAQTGVAPLGEAVESYRRRGPGIEKAGGLSG